MLVLILEKYRITNPGFYHFDLKTHAFNLGVLVGQDNKEKECNQFLKMFSKLHYFFILL